MHFTAGTTSRRNSTADVRIRGLFIRRVWRAVLCRWIVGAEAGPVSVSGRSGQVAGVRWAWSHGGGGGGGVSVAVCVGQTALDSELQQLVISQVTVERIILDGQTGSCRSRARHAGCRHDGAASLKQTKKKRSCRFSSCCHQCSTVQMVNNLDLLVENMNHS